MKKYNSIQDIRDEIDKIDLEIIDLISDRKDLVDEADLPKPLTQRVAEAALNTVESNLVSQIPKVLRKL